MALGIAGLLILILFVVFVLTIFLAWRHRLAFRIAMRNVRRGKARTILLVAGLLVGTTIITGSLIVGDTVSTLVTHYSYLGAGYHSTTRIPCTVRRSIRPRDTTRSPA